MCSNSVVGPLLTDLYQIRMAYAYWKVGKNSKRKKYPGENSLAKTKNQTLN